MIKLNKSNELYKCVGYTTEVVEIIKEVISILDENYGIDREVDKELGGYVLIAENIVDIEILTQNILKNVIAEYTDLIECKVGVNYTSSLFLLSSDFSIVVVTTEALSKLLLK